MSIPRIAIKLDQVALWRKARRSELPEPVAVAQAIGQAGADAVVCGYQSGGVLTLRDLQLLRQAAGLPLVLELAALQDNLRVAYDVKPDAVVIVPDPGEDLVAAEGVDVARGREQLRAFVQGLRDAEIRAGIMLEPDLDQVRNAHRLDVQQVVIHGRRLSLARTEAERRHELERVVDVVKTAARLGLEVHVAGGLTPRELRVLGPLEELHGVQVGHWALSRALFIGLAGAVAEIAAVLREGPRR